jgi:hypothetical protein
MRAQMGRAVRTKLVPVTSPVATMAPSDHTVTPIHRMRVSVKAAPNICTKPKVSRTMAQLSRGKAALSDAFAISFSIFSPFGPTMGFFGRKLEAQTSFFRNLVAKRHVMPDFIVEVRHAFSGPPQPNQELMMPGGITHRRSVAGRGILRNYGQNNNSPETCLWRV